ncbi:MAG: UDP-N-acetylmuramoyl-L-alanyl-D-glutamate--2,6-diaminopimelate ligase [Deltaproteobacteria bacterium]|nr:UDP-N-acetylmuramoyl-L-alanyl-D-glutamate--2,6-diaminopimelate ligase [Deltaproteobacteria bacterium]
MSAGTAPYPFVEPGEIRPRFKVAAVTGTNGKTSTTTMIASIVRHSGEHSARLTTVGAWVDDTELTSPSPSELFFDWLSLAVLRDVKTLALEVTSKALVYGFAQRFPADVAVFTNLTRDHIEAHGSPEAYLAAKAQLFMTLPDGGLAVLNADDPSARLIDEVTPASVRRLWYSTAGAEADLVATRIEVSPEGTRIALAATPLGLALRQLEIPMVGVVQAANALAAALAAHALGYSPPAIGRGLAGSATVPGRFSIIHREPTVVVDYAHTPDGLRGTLESARRLTTPPGRVWCVFGCGGERDRAKRPEMGAVAAELADRVILTTDNPRSEDPRSIVEQIAAGVPASFGQLAICLDRRAAIALAIGSAATDDVVIVAGKGHESGQEVDDAVLPFSDFEVVSDALQAARITR